MELHFWVGVGFLQRAHVLVNEAAARAGRGQAIAPTMPRSDIPSASIVGAMACPRPGAHATIVRAPYTSAYLDKYLSAELSYIELPVLFKKGSLVFFFFTLPGFRAFASIILS